MSSDSTTQKPTWPTMQDLKDRRFGRWTVIGKDARRLYWLCRCDCGTIRPVLQKTLSGGNSTGCGCQRRETMLRVHSRHGKCRTDEYNVWSHMINRCGNPKDAAYHNYGGRGITVCERWRNCFEAFLEDMGLKPSSSHSIDRINNDGDYEPSNCRWATRDEQQNNTRRNLRITFNGETHTLKQWSKIVGIPYPALLARVQRFGWSYDEALTTPLLSLSEASHFKHR